MAVNYGLPYKGSKNKIATKIANFLPAATNLYDLFAGGCAVTHAAMLYTGKWQNYIINDISGIVALFEKAVRGDYKDETRWISSEEFIALKDTDDCARICWSFGNDGKSYLYSKDLESWKRAFHYAVVFCDFEPMKEWGLDLSFIGKICDIDGRRRVAGKYIRKNIQSVKRLYELQSLQRLESLQRLQSLQGLERLQRLESLQGLQSLQRLESLQSDYRNVEIKPNSVIYCDIPYKGTVGYNGERFDHAAFYDWCERQTVPVFISEYWMPEDRFVCVKEYRIKRKMSATQSQLCIEKIFRPKCQL